MKTLFILLFFSLIFIIYLISYRRMLKKKKLRLSEREDLDPEQFFILFYEKSGLPKDIVIQILKQISVRTEMPITKLRPDDRFDKELRPVKGWEFDNGLGLLNLETTKILQKKGVQMDLTSIKTIDDYIRLVAPLIVEHEIK